MQQKSSLVLEFEGFKLNSSSRLFALGLSKKLNKFQIKIESTNNC